MRSLYHNSISLYCDIIDKKEDAFMTLKIKPKPKQRVLITSDVHGNLVLFKKILKDMKFSTSDILIIDGDMSEKGNDSIGLFKYIIELKKDFQVYATLGNCDDLINFLRDDNRNRGMENYMDTRGNTILSEFRKEFGPYTNFMELKRYAFDHYPEIFDFVMDLPVIIESPYFTCVHAGLLDHENQDRDFNLKQPRFFDYNASFDKPVIVGHYPVCLYSTSYMSHAPLFDPKKNIWAIDGGNVIKEEGQLNVLEFIDSDVSVHSFDLLEYVSLGIVQSREDRVHLNWEDLDIEITTPGDEFSLCTHLSTGNQLEIFNEFLDFENNVLTSDYTNSQVEVKENDVVHIIKEASSGYYVKCNSFIGWLLKPL